MDLVWNILTSFMQAVENFNYIEEFLWQICLNNFYTWMRLLAAGLIFTNWVMWLTWPKPKIHALWKLVNSNNLLWYAVLRFYLVIMTTDCTWQAWYDKLPSSFIQFDESIILFQGDFNGCESKHQNAQHVCTIPEHRPGPQDIKTPEETTHKGYTAPSLGGYACVRNLRGIYATGPAPCVSCTTQFLTTQRIQGWATHKPCSSISLRGETFHQKVAGIDQEKTEWFAENEVREAGIS